MPREPLSFASNAAFTYPGHFETEQERLEAFRARQQADLDLVHSSTTRRRRFHERYAIDESKNANDHISNSSGEEAWRTSEGDRLKDFGVDEDAEFYDEDNIPLAQLFRRKMG